MPFGRRRRLPATAIAGLLFTAVLPLGAVAWPSPAASPTSAAVDQRQAVIVRVASTADPGEVATQLVSQHGGGSVRIYRHALRGFAAELPATAVRALRRDPQVLDVEPDQTVRAFATVPRGIRRVGADASPAAAINGADERPDVDIAILDTGVDGAHPDLRVAGAVDCLFGSCSVSQATDLNGHGTHVAGTAAAIDNATGVVGLAAGARIWSVRVLDPEGAGPLSAVIAGLDWVRQNADQIEVANASFGCRCQSTSLNTAVSALAEAGTVLTVAPGNEGQLADDMAPANHPDAIAVSAISDYDGQPGGKAAPTCEADLDDRFAWYSNYGSVIDLAAPGSCIVSTFPGGRYAESSGTSMAAPHVAGAAALYILTNKLARGPSRPATVRDGLRRGWAVAQSNACGFTGGKSDEPLLHLTCVQANQAPTVRITAPADGALLAAGDPVTLSGQATDAEDGDLGASIAWSSSIDGPLGSGASITVRLSAGSHVITATVSDSGGASGNASIQVTAEKPSGTSTEPSPEPSPSIPPEPTGSPTPDPPRPNTQPTVTITAPVAGATLAASQPVKLAGSASDPEDGDLSARMTWHSDRDGALGTGGTIQATLSAGTHALTAKVADADGATATVEVSVQVQTNPVGRAIDHACPAGRVPEDGFTDVPSSQLHEPAIDCIVWWQVARGTTATTYSPGKTVTRAQMASFIASLIERSGGELPRASRDHFPDDDGSPHEANINRLAEAGVVGGKPDGTYRPLESVSRGQMATFLVHAYEARTGRQLVAVQERFSDDNRTVHEANINAAACAGFAGGTRPGTYDPAAGVRRDQMAAFLARVLDLLVEQGFTQPPR